MCENVSAAFAYTTSVHHIVYYYKIQILFTIFCVFFFFHRILHTHTLCIFSHMAMYMSCWNKRTIFILLPPQKLYSIVVVFHRAFCIFRRILRIFFANVCKSLIWIFPYLHTCTQMKYACEIASWNFPFFEWMAVSLQFLVLQSFCMECGATKASNWKLKIMMRDLGSFKSIKYKNC